MKKKSRRFPVLVSRINLPREEEKILQFWQKNKVFEKSLAKNRGKKRFVFFEGPPTANAAPGLHNVLARAFKDLFPRYKTMQGFLVERKAGWDTHGLPVEIALEKELKITSKEEIEKFGVDKFNALAKKHTWNFKEAWEELTKRMGFWLDLKHPYITYEPAYIETLWWIIKQAWDKGLLYKGHKVVPHCPRCGTALSSHEVALGYEEIEEDSIFVKFRVKTRENTYILAWTTTPWTLPGNVALAVDPNIPYLEVEKSGEHLILAEALAEKVLGNFKKVKKFKGKELVGLSYKPLFEVPSLGSETSYKVYPADFVTTDEGTGVVHTAVMYGEDDYQLGEKVGLPKVHTVDEGGRFLPQVTKWAGRFVKDKKVEREIVEDLKKRGLLLKITPYKHDYPFCWRCETPLLYYAKDSWFIKMSELRSKLIANNQKVNWVPAHLKEGRFGEWLSEVKDWAFSRERYWGTPLPIWESKKGDRICIGSFAELRKLAKNKKKIGRDFDPHRPLVDEIVLVKQGKEYRRVPEVVDVWFDSGAMPFGEWHYPFENKDKIDKQLAFPADFIAEGVDQTRGWFYTLLAVSTLLDRGPAYKNVISLGHVLDRYGKKMSKSKGNVVMPEEVINRLGADALRFYFYSVNQPGLSKNFDPRDVEKLVRNLTFRLYNSLVFFTTYVNSSSFLPQKKRPHPRNLLDRWILARFDEASSQVTSALDHFDTFVASQTLLALISDLSNWYVRRSRKRFFQNPDKKDEKEAYATLYYLLRGVSILLAPFVPFLSEMIYRVLRLPSDPLSVHLENWPKLKLTSTSKKILSQMKEARRVVEEGLHLREEAGIRVRQPLNTLYLLDKFSTELSQILADEINVKHLKRVSRLPQGRYLKGGARVTLDAEITPTLAGEGLIREVIRLIQERRKKLSLTVRDKVMIKWYSPNPSVIKLIKQKSKGIEKETLGSLKLVSQQIGEKIEVRGLRLYLQVDKT